MPDERDLLDFQPDEPPKKDEVSPPSQEDTEPLLFMFDDDRDGTLDDLDVLDEHDQPTMPLPSGTNRLESDPGQTLAGSGGLDPNPDFQNKSPAQSSPNQHTQPHVVPFEHTLVHVPGESRPYPQQNSPQRPAQTQQAAPRNPYQANTQQGQQYRQTVPSPYAPPPPPTIPAPPQGGRPNYPPPRQGYGVGPQGQPLPRPPRRLKRKRILGCTPGCFMLLAGIFVTFCGGITLLGLVITATLGSQLEERLGEQVAQVDDYNNFESTFYYDREGGLLYEAFGEGRRVNVPYANFPQDLINATIAIEDDTFFTNPGFEVEATLRAFLQYVGLSEGASGGSTITQQLVRNVLFEPEYRAERSVQRKVEEILLAFMLRQRKSPEEVLEMYLNEIYYGNLSYGAESAALTFFDKHVGELTLGEAALLAGLPQAPATLDPFSPDPVVQQEVRARWELVLARMVEEGYITDAQRQQAIAAGLNFIEPEAPLEAPHFTVYAMQEYNDLMSSLGYSPEQIVSGGFRVYTTVDQSINEMAQQTARNQVAALAANNASNGAVIVLQPSTGEILAMVGSLDYDNEAIDGRVNVTTSLRQPGSTMKPFTYSAALEQGMTPADIIWDTQTDIAGYRPLNYDRTFHGAVRMRTALANSYNIPAVQTLRRIGVEGLLEIMARFGVESLTQDASQYGLSLTLGGGDITLLELSTAYAVFANGGSYVPSTSIRCVLDNDGHIIYEYRSGCPSGEPTENTVYSDGYGTQVLDPRIAYLISDILADEEARQPAMGYHSALYTGDIGASVKTGTTDDFRDNWTVGYTRNVVVGVWVGNSDGTPMSNVSGLTGAAPIWNAIISALYNNQDMLAELAVDGQLLPNRMDPPGGMTLQGICALSALREPALDCAGQTAEWMFDTPAGLFDGGGIYYPAAPIPTPEQPPASGVWLREVQPDIYRVLVHPIPQSIAQGIVFGVAPGQIPPPAPLYCQVPVELAPYDPGAREQLFIGPPLDPADSVQAENYARGAGIPFLPTIACSQDLINAAGSASPVVTAFIASPANGQTISGPFDIVGTAQFSPEQADYYKIEIFGGPFTNWTTVNNIHSTSVVNGVLESLPALSPGSYQFQLVVVGRDGNYVQPPYQISVNVQ